MRIYKIFVLCAALLLLCACGNGAVSAEVTATVSTAQTTVPTQTTEAPPSAGSAETQAAAPQTTQASTTLPFGITMPEEDYTTMFTDDPSNKFIAAVAEKYGLDTSLLAAVYTEPVSDSNQVWQFNGKTDSSGKLLRNADTLKYVYSISADCSQIKRTGGLTGNDGYNAVSGYVVFTTTKQMMLPEFEAELNA